MRLCSDFVLELAEGNILSWNQANSRVKVIRIQFKVVVFLYSWLSRKFT